MPSLFCGSIAHWRLENTQGSTGILWRSWRPCQSRPRQGRREKTTCSTGKTSMLTECYRLLFIRNDIIIPVRKCRLMLEYLFWQIWQQVLCLSFVGQITSCHFTLVSTIFAGISLTTYCKRKQGISCIIMGSRSIYVRGNLDNHAYSFFLK